MAFTRLGQVSPCTSYNINGVCQSYDPNSSVDVSDAEALPSSVNVEAPFASMGIDDLTAQLVQPYTSVPAGYSGPTVIGYGDTPPNPPAGYQWTSVQDGTGNGVAQVMTLSQGGGTTLLTNGASLNYGSGVTVPVSTTTTTTTTDYSSLLWLAAAGVAAYMIFGIGHLDQLSPW